MADDDAAARAQAVIDLMNKMDLESGVTPIAQPVVQPKTSGMFNFLANLPVLGGYLRGRQKAAVPAAMPAQVPAQGGAIGALMQRKMLTEALKGGQELSDEQLIKMMSPQRQ